MRQTQSPPHQPSAWRGTLQHTAGLPASILSVQICTRAFCTLVRQKTAAEPEKKHYCRTACRQLIYRSLHGYSVHWCGKGKPARLASQPHPHQLAQVAIRRAPSLLEEPRNMSSAAFQGQTVMLQQRRLCFFCFAVFRARVAVFMDSLRSRFCCFKRASFASKLSCQAWLDGGKIKQHPADSTGLFFYVLCVPESSLADWDKSRGQ